MRLIRAGENLGGGAISIVVDIGFLVGIGLTDRSPCPLGFIGPVYGSVL